MSSQPRCLMLAGGSVARVTGYSIRVWFALRAVRTVQGANGPRPVLLSLESLRNWLRPGTFCEARQQAEEAGVQLVCLPLWPKKMPGSTWVNWVWSAFLVRLAVWWWEIGVVHAQSHFAASAAARALRANRRTKLVFDIHGVDMEERLADGRLIEGTAAYRTGLASQRLAIERADWLLAVSQSLAEHLEAPRDRVRIVPCVSSLPLPEENLEEVRRETREQLAVADRPVLLYLGGASAWQQPEFVVECFSELLQLLPQAVMLIITGDPEAFAELFRARRVVEDAYRIRSLPHGEVASVAAAADAGLLLRENTIVNRVASPTKFAEYLAVGVPVVLTEVLSDFAAITREENVGLVVDSSASATEVAADLASFLRQEPERSPSVRRACREAFAQWLSFESILPIYQELYVPQPDRLPKSEDKDRLKNVSAGS